MKTIITLILLSVLTLNGYAQNAQTYFNSSASYYVKDKKVEAMQTIRDGLAKYPNDEKLKALAEKMKQEKKEEDKKEQEKKEEEKKEQEKKDQEKKEEQNQDKKEQEKKDQEKKDQENKDQKEKEEEKKNPEKDKQQSEQEKKEQQKQSNPEMAEKLEKMNITPEAARKLLDAMKNQESQYLQQNKRKATKSKDKTKPDW